MKKRYLALTLLVLTLVILSSCNDTNHGELTSEDKDLTVDYLEEDYVPLLLKDGAEYYFGNIEVKSEDGIEDDLYLGIDVKVLVEYEDVEGTGYIENSNMYKEMFLPHTAKCTYISSTEKTPKVLTPSEFAEIYFKEREEKGESYMQSKFYDVYTMNNEAVLIMEHELLDGIEYRDESSKVDEQDNSEDQ